MTLQFWTKATQELSKQDPVMGRLIAQYQGEFLQSRGDAFFTLARSIIGQQISVKAADSVWNKLSHHFEIQPGVIAAATPEALRACGLSQSKATYLTLLAQFFMANPNVVQTWQGMADEPLIKEISTLHGIGRWTAEMFLIFHLMRSDILPLADIGLQKAVFIHYNNNEKMPLADIKQLAKLWRPWRSVATWYLWRSLDPVPVAY